MSLMKFILGSCLMLGLISITALQPNARLVAEQIPDSHPTESPPKEKGYQPLIPVNVKKSRDDGLSLGNGSSLDRISPAHGTAFQKPRAREVLKDPETSFKML